MCGGALVGLALAVAALVVLDRRRRLVLGAADAVSAAGIGVAADVVVPRRPATDGPVLTASHLEPYRLLLEALGAQPEPEVLVVLGASAAAGTALRSIDVAVAAADAGRRTVLVGTAARGRRRSVAEVLAGDAGALPDAEALLLPTDRPGLRVLPLAWPAASDPVSMAALDSRRFSLLLDRIRADADLTVIAGPSLREGEVALRLAGLADGALLIATAGRWTRESCRRTVALLQRTGCRVAGIVLVRRGRRTAVPTGWEVRRSRSRDDAPTPPDHPPAREAVPLRLVSDDDPAGQLARAVRAAGAGGGRARAADGAAPAASHDRLAPVGTLSAARRTEHGR
jgi:Mrp family chromosome partitioning ATPase